MPAKQEGQHKLVIKTTKLQNEINKNGIITLYILDISQIQPQKIWKPLA